jgi:hypothetical protein
MPFWKKDPNTLLMKSFLYWRTYKTLPLKIWKIWNLLGVLNNNCYKELNPTLKPLGQTKRLNVTIYKVKNLPYNTKSMLEKTKPMPTTPRSPKTPKTSRN